VFPYILVSLVYSKKAIPQKTITEAALIFVTPLIPFFSAGDLIWALHILDKCSTPELLP
jgi:hypothetical protein